MSSDAVMLLAQAAGLSREWTDAYGKPQTTSVDTMRAILAALGFACSTEADCRDSIAQLSRGERESLPPLITAVAGQPLALADRPELSGQPYRLELEDGTIREGRFADGHNAAIALPAVETIGYHRLTVGESSVTVAVAPSRCYGIADAAARRDASEQPLHPRLWGLAVQLYSLRQQGDGGIGHFSALEQLARSAAEKGAAAVAISPVHAMFSADVNRFSPYGPSSRLFLNALHVDPARVLGADALATAIAGLDAGSQQRLHHLEQQSLIDWPGAAGIRLDLLRALYRQYIAMGTRSELDAFIHSGGDALRDHACFEALQADRLAAGETGYWRHWPEALRRPQNTAVRQFAQDRRDEVDFHLFLQWQAAKGLSAAQRSACAAGMPIGLIADLAVGADNGGSQAWSRQDEILTGLSVGAPPDQMNARGQSWGLGAFSPHAMRKKGFHAYIEMLRAVFAHAGGVRIDHVLGLARLWLVPDGASADQGAYLKYPMEDLLRLIALESWRHRAIVIGEDLGTVPPGFDKVLARAGLLGIRVLFFQRHQHGFQLPREWSSDAIATTTTHDLPTVAGWWSGRDIDWRTQLDLHPIGETGDDAQRGRAGEREQLWQALSDSGCANGRMPDGTGNAALLDAAACFIGKTPAPLAILPIEDALGLPEQPNLPGTIDSHPNWRRRLPVDVDGLLDGPAVAGRLARLDQARNGEK